MKFFSSLIIWILSASACISQPNISVQFINLVPSGRNLLVMMKDSVAIDTLLECGRYELIDYIIKSKNQVSIIVGDWDSYHYYQFYRSELYDFWSIDSTAQWNKPSWPPDRKNPNYPDPRAKYALKDFNTVIKIVDDTQTVMNLKTQKSETARPPMHERELEHIILLFSEDPQKEWRDIDSVFRNHIVLTSSLHLRHFAFLMMVRKKDFLQKADIKSLNYYAYQFEMMEFFYDIKFYILFFKNLSNFWPQERISEYARNMDKKNTIYWACKFSTPYWDYYKTEKEELQQLMYTK